MLANTITISRLLLTFVVITLFGKDVSIDTVALVTIVLIFILDAVDGYVARTTYTTSLFGAVFDIAVDRIIENVFWIYFAVNDIIHLWMPIAVLTRGFTTDAVRSFALSENKTPFEMMKREWTRALTSSRVSRFLSGASKMCAFCSMGVCLMLQSHELFPEYLERIQTVTQILAITTVAICLLRGVPVIIDGITHIQIVRTYNTPTAKHPSSIKET